MIKQKSEMVKLTHKPQLYTYVYRIIFERLFSPTQKALDLIILINNSNSKNVLAILPINFITK